ncbi:MAG: NUDIX hydrolase [Bacteroidota bacterium]|jgi:8-oxo-dGTP diphosphatase
MSKILVKIKNNNFKSAHVVIIKDEKILILRRSPTDEWMPGHYGLPGGKLDPNENLLDALTRECKEEVGLEVFPKHLIFLPKISSNKEHAFFYTTKFNGEPKLDFEHDDFQWINPNNLSKYKVVPDLPDIVKEVLEDLM